MKYWIVFVLSALGVGLVVDGFQRTAEERALRELNPLELKSSPYGEIVGAALQDPVSIIHHGGIGHKHVGEGDESETCGVSHGGGSVEGRPKMTELKLNLRRLESGIRQNNLPGNRSAEVLAYEKEKVKELMTLAYEMDPTNQGNYAVYSNFAAEEGGFEALYKVSQNTLKACEGRVSDPGDALSAAVAAETILVYRDMEMKRRGVENAHLEGDYQLLEQNVLRFKSSFERAIADGRLAHFSQEKADDMLAVYARLNWAVRSYKEKVSPTGK
ncbi:hypothetical protein [Rubritalea profundi]|uniref:Uncharacterized protein n=1 Tax=Rubritalea profundi TaxID=1658618 RepID=A0A2S7U4G1_9BACT|nr:hypothetical protein [Rubritalea profundi]PQJ29274.1 hypothetical protein BSZ32_12735 [Rubritalea profundi]